MGINGRQWQTGGIPRNACGIIHGIPGGGSGHPGGGSGHPGGMSCIGGMGCMLAADGSGYPCCIMGADCGGSMSCMGADSFLG